MQKKRRLLKKLLKEVLNEATYNNRNNDSLKNRGWSLIPKNNNFEYGDQKTSGGTANNPLTGGLRCINCGGTIEWLDTGQFVNVNMKDLVADIQGVCRYCDFGHAAIFKPANKHDHKVEYYSPLNIELGKGYIYMVGYLYRKWRSSYNDKRGKWYLKEFMYKK